MGLLDQNQPEAGPPLTVAEALQALCEAQDNLERARMLLALQKRFSVSEFEEIVSLEALARFLRTPPTSSDHHG